MISRFVDRWQRLHWVTRLSILSVLVAILWWQARYTRSFGNPQYGWPISFDGLWDLNRRPSLVLLLVDCAVWLMLARSTGYVIETWWRQPHRFPLTHHTVISLSIVLVVLLVLGGIEAYFRIHPNNGSITPKYACVNLGSIDIWFDIGLFTDPVYDWPLARIVVIGAIGCTVYTMGRLPYLCAQRCVRSVAALGGREKGTYTHAEAPDGTVAATVVPSSDDRVRPACRTPIMARIAIWLLFMILTLWAISWLLFPRVVS